MEEQLKVKKNIYFDKMYLILFKIKDRRSTNSLPKEIQINQRKK